MTSYSEISVDFDFVDDERVTSTPDGFTANNSHLTPICQFSKLTEQT